MRKSFEDDDDWEYAGETYGSTVLEGTNERESEILDANGNPFVIKSRKRPIGFRVRRS